MKTVVALYDQISDANAAVKELVEYGIPRDNISLMASDLAGNYSSYLSRSASGETMAETMDGTVGGAATGAGVGAIVGGLGGLLIGLGVLAVPGVGPVLAAGPLATAISALTGAGGGAMAGGAAGGLLGALVDLGLPEETAGNYAEGVRRGGTLVTVRAEDHQAEDVRRIMNRYKVVNLDERVRSWRDQGWTGYNADLEEPAGGAGSTPYTEGVQDDHARHPEGGLYGVMNTPDERGWRSSRVSDSIHNSGRTSASATTTGFDRFGPSDWESDAQYRIFDPDFQSHYTTNYANRGHNYDYYRPAYYYGYWLAGHERYRDWTWDKIEPEARREWVRRGDLQETWEDFKGAVQHAWMRVKEGVRATFD